jgi:hypothetical protein
MSSQKPWTPHIEGQPLLHPFASPEGDKSRPSLELRDPQEDTAPLQGTQDISDADSLQDVVADAESKQHGTSPES